MCSASIRLLLLLPFALLAPANPATANLTPVKWQEKIVVASGGGYQGPWRMNESDWRYVDDPTVAINDAGAIAVAWADQARKDIFLQVYEANGKQRFDHPVNVSRSPRVFSWLPRVHIMSGSASEIYVLWQEIVFSGGTHGGEIFFARSADGGKTFSVPINLSNTTAGAGKGRLTRRHWHNGSLDLAIGPAGEVYAAWTEYEGALRFSRSSDGGRSFADPVHVAGDDAVPARSPALAVDANGTVYLAWTVGESRTADIHFAKSPDAGRSFDGPRVVFKSGGHSDAPKIAVDSEGTVHLVFAESPAGPFERYHISYTRSTDSGRQFEQPREISNGHTEKFDSVSFPSLAFSGADKMYAIWELFPSRREFPRGLGFTYSSDGGKSFGAPATIPGSADPAFGFNGSRQGFLMRKLAVNRSGTLAVVNSSFKWNKASRIWLFRAHTGAP